MTRRPTKPISHDGYWSKVDSASAETCGFYRDALVDGQAVSKRTYCRTWHCQRCAELLAKKYLRHFGLKFDKSPEGVWYAVCAYDDASWEPLRKRVTRRASEEFGIIRRDDGTAHIYSRHSLSNPMLPPHTGEWLDPDAAYDRLREKTLELPGPTRGVCGPWGKLPKYTGPQYPTISGKRRYHRWVTDRAAQLFNAAHAATEVTHAEAPDLMQPCLGQAVDEWMERKSLPAHFTDTTAILHAFNKGRGTLEPFLSEEEWKAWVG